MTDADPCQRRSKAGEKCGFLFNRCGTGYTCSGGICKPTIIDVDDIMKLINDKKTKELTELLRGIYLLERNRIREGRPALINDTDCQGFTPLMRAALIPDNWEIITILIDAGADTSIQHKLLNNFTALMFAIVKETVVEKGNVVKEKVVKKGNISNISPLVYYDPGINLQATGGITALMLAFLSDYILDIVTLLLNNGADPTIKNDRGQTARDIAQSMVFDENWIKNKEEVIKLLEDREKEIRTPHGLYSRTNKDLLRKGGFGTVFKVKRNGKNVALKAITFKNPKQNIPAFYNEINMFKRVKNSKYTLQLLNSEISSNDKTGFIVTNVMSGQDLIDAINKKLITDDNIEQVTRDLLNGLDEIHQSGIIHADIKPDNIRFLQDPSAGTTIKYFDFGLSCAINSCRGPIRGSQGYMKQVKIAQWSKTYYEYDKTDDFYALAVTLWHCRTSVQTKRPWLQGVVDRLVDLDPTQKATDALPPAVVGGNRRTKRRSDRRYRI